MITQPYQLYLERTDTKKNMDRFYSMSIQPNLFGDFCLTRRWGRIGTRGQTMSHHFDAEREAVILLLEVLRQKKRRGYATAGRRVAIETPQCGSDAGSVQALTLAEKAQPNTGIATF